MVKVFRMKYWKWAIVIIVLMALGITGLSIQTSLRPEAGEEETGYKQTAKRKDVAEIKFILDPNGPYWNQVTPISITDNKMIYDIMSMIEESKPLTDERKIGNMSGMARKNNKLILSDMFQI